MKKKSSAKRSKKLDPLDSPQWISESSASTVARVATPADDSSSGSESGSAGGGTKVAISNIPRVPIYGNTPGNLKKCTITIFPADVTLTASIERVQSIGSKGLARFEQGGTSIQVTGTKEVSLAGVENSDVKDNMRLIVKAGEKILAETRFSVRTWPKEGAFNPNEIGRLNGGLLCHFRWTSESGTVQDLTGIEVGEIVNYNPELPSPPYGKPLPINPTILASAGNTTEPGHSKTKGYIRDLNSSKFFDKPYSASTNTAIQNMGFWDLVLDGPRTKDNQRKLQWGIQIKRSLAKIPFGQWFFLIEKLGVVSKEYSLPE